MHDPRVPAPVKLVPHDVTIRPLRQTEPYPTALGRIREVPPSRANRGPGAGPRFSRHSYPATNSTGLLARELVGDAPRQLPQKVLLLFFRHLSFDDQVVRGIPQLLDAVSPHAPVPDAVIQAFVEGPFLDHL